MVKAHLFVFSIFCLIPQNSVHAGGTFSGLKKSNKVHAAPQQEQEVLKNRSDTPEKSRSSSKLYVYRIAIIQKQKNAPQAHSIPVTLPDTLPDRLPKKITWITTEPEEIGYTLTYKQSKKDKSDTIECQAHFAENGFETTFLEELRELNKRNRTKKNTVFPMPATP